MSNTSKLIAKEVKELMTPATIIPIVILALVFGSLGSASRRRTSQREADVGIINQGDGPLSLFVHDSIASTEDRL
jgi:hypothetical protein